MATQVSGLAGGYVTNKGALNEACVIDRRVVYSLPILANRLRDVLAE
jgi:hypothetical protein